ncbi:MAG: tRNA(Ile)-lysidine synthase [Methanoregula sp.]|nr:tRNA(Ile)-lysidine synthase [Methanoregula sp.]
MQCSKCHRDAIIFQPYSGVHLCGQHVVADVEAKAKKMIRAQGWLRPGDHIAVLLTDDKNSSALLYFLKQLTAQRSDITVSAIIIADGSDTQCETSRAKRIAEMLDTELLVVSWPEDADIGNDTGTGKDRDCTSLPLLPVSRAILPDAVAQQHGITKIAWGLCLDDAAGVVLESIIRGDGEKLVRGISCQQVPLRICPFISVPAAEVSLYATLCGYNDEQAPGPERGDDLHKDTVAHLDSYTNNHPATKYALLNLGESLADFPKGIAGLIHACEWYGKCPRGTAINAHHRGN